MEYLATGVKKVNGVDLDKGVLEMCETNLRESGFSAKTELIQGNVFDDNLLKSIKANIVVYDIPFWYSQQQEGRGNLIYINPALKHGGVEREASVTLFNIRNIIVQNGMSI